MAPANDLCDECIQTICVTPKTASCYVLENRNKCGECNPWNLAAPVSLFEQFDFFWWWPQKARAVSHYWVVHGDSSWPRQGTVLAHQKAWQLAWLVGVEKDRDRPTRRTSAWRHLRGVKDVKRSVPQPGARAFWFFIKTMGQQHVETQQENPVCCT